MTLLSIGLPVYNEENHIYESVSSILKQTFKDFELIIIDNNSTDNTYEILKSFQVKDSRIKLFKNIDNFGSDKNFNDTFFKAKSKYFMWAGSHDLIEPNYLETIFNFINSLHTPPDLTFTSISHIDEDGKIILNYKEVGYEFNTKNLLSYLMLPWRIKGSGDMVYGVFKRESISQTRIFSKVFYPDVLLMYEMCMIGKTFRITQPLRKRRIFFDEEISQADNWKDTYKIKTSRFRKKGLKVTNVRWYSYLPTQVMFFQIIYSIGVKDNLFNIIRLFYSIYFALVYLYKHKIAFLIDLKSFIEVVLIKKFFNFR